MRKNEIKVNLVFNANYEQPLGRKLLKGNKNETNRLTRPLFCYLLRKLRTSTLRKEENGQNIEHSQKQLVL